MSLKSIFLDCGNVVNGLKTYMGISHPMERGNINDVIENKEFLKEILRNEKHWNILDASTVAAKVEATPDQLNPSYVDILLNSTDYIEYPAIKYIDMMPSNFSLLHKIGLGEGNGKQILSDILADKEPIILLDCLTDTGYHSYFDKGFGYLLRGIAERKGLNLNTYVSSYLSSYFDVIIADDEILSLLTHPKLYRKAVECLVNTNQNGFTTKYCLYNSSYDTINPLLASGRIASGHRLMIIGGRAVSTINNEDAFQPCKLTGLGEYSAIDPTDGNKKILQLRAPGNASNTTSGTAHSYSMVDLTHVKKIIFDIALDRISGSPSLLFGVGPNTSNTYSTSSNYYTAYQQFINMNSSKARKTYEVDVSELSGQYYIKFTYQDNTSSVAESVNINIYEISLEF